MIFLQLLNRSKQKKTAFFYFFFHLFLCTISRSFRQHTIGIIKKRLALFSNCTIIFCMFVSQLQQSTAYLNMRLSAVVSQHFSSSSLLLLAFFLFCFVNLKSIEPFMANFTQLHSSTSIIQFKQMNTMRFSMIVFIKILRG